MNSINKPLKNCSILLTRPLAQTRKLEQALQDLGAHTSTFPCIEILPPKNTATLHFALQHLATFDIAIFTSANAVTPIVPYWHDELTAKVIAIGPGTQSALARHNIHTEVPTTYNSEGLLNFPLLNQVDKLNIAIFCGENPRSLLADTLRKRGAFVNEIFCYRRQMPHTDAIAALYVLKKANINIITSASQESLQNLYTMLGEKGRDWLLDQSLVVIDKNMVELAKKLGFKHDIILADNATDNAMLKALLNWQQQINNKESHGD